MQSSASCRAVHRAEQCIVQISASCRAVHRAELCLPSITARPASQHALHHSTPCITARLASQHALHHSTPCITARPASLHALHHCTPCITARPASLHARHRRACKLRQHVSPTSQAGVVIGDKRSTGEAAAKKARYTNPLFPAPWLGFGSLHLNSNLNTLEPKETLLNNGIPIGRTIYTRLQRVVAN